MRDLDTFGSRVEHRTARAAASTMIVFLSAIVSSIAMTTVPTSAQPLNQWKCTGKPDFSPEEQITGCSGAIRSGKLVGKDLAAAFTIRGSAYRVHGDLTITGTTRPVTLDVTYEGQIPDPFGAGSHRAGFTAETTLSRKEFGMTYSPALETGGVAVGDKVKVSIHFEAVRQG